MNWAAWIAWTIGAYVVTTVVAATSLGDFLPEGAISQRFKWFAGWAVIIGFVASGYVDSYVEICN